MRKRIISLVLAFCIVISLLAVPALADVPVHSGSPTVSGVWVFNEKVNTDFSYANRIVQDVNFSYENYAGVVSNCIQIIIGQTSSTNDKGVRTLLEDGTYQFLTTGKGLWSYNYISENRTIDFGSTEQEVSAEFYAWFTANATQQAVECTHTNTEVRNATDYYTGDTYCADCDELISSGTYAINGWWQFNENIVAPITAPLVENIAFSCLGILGTNYESLGWTGTDIGIYYDDVKVYDDITGWSNDNYRTVNFGETLIPVSEDFLTWLSANAVNLSYADGVPLCIYDSDNSVLYPSFNVSYGSVLTVTDTGFTITDTAGVEESYPCAPGIAGITFLGLSSSPDQTSAEYPVGKQIVLTGATDLYVVLLKLPIYAYLYSSDGQLLKILEALGDSTLTVNSNSLVLTGVDGVSDVYDLSLGADETFLGLSLEVNQNYSVNYSVGQSILMSSSMNFYLVSEYPYPVAVYWNAGGVIKYFTGLNSCTVRVNDTSVDFIAHDGTVETLDIPLSGDDAFWGLATSPSQKTPTYRPGSTITVYDAKNLFIVRQSDYNKLVIDENTTDIGEDEELEADTSALKEILKDFKSFIKTNVSFFRIVEIFRDENNYSWFTPETASQLDTAPSAVSTFSFDDVESDYEKYNMQAYDERLNLLMSFMGGDDE